eukprot:m.253764 g.253764  ORF g.253764 m.253764 type:complete len:1317 (+) comp15488_c0_seq1:101-4051(+)
MNKERMISPSLWLVAAFVIVSANYVHIALGAACICSAGKLQVQSECIECAPGYACRNGCTASACRLGSYQDRYGQDVCKTCSAGKFTGDQGDTRGYSSCAKWTSCTPGTYISSPGTSTADRSCTLCADGTFTSEINQDSCYMWSNCLRDQYVLQVGTSSSDAQCVDKTLCSPGQYVSLEATATTDRVCTDCDTGKYSDANNAQECMVLSTCMAGEYVSTAPTLSTDRTCMPCSDDTFSTEANQNECDSFTHCPAGTFISKPGSMSSDQQCSTCSVGYFASEENQQVCLPWKDCNPGSFVSTQPEMDIDRDCSPCPSGFYSPGTNTQSCNSWTTCPPGQYIGSDGTLTSDRTCLTCSSDEFSTTSDSTSCTAAQSCTLGTFVSQDRTPSTDRQCQPCAEGYFSNQLNSQACQPCSVCDEGDVILFSCTPQSNTVCAKNFGVILSHPDTKEPIKGDRYEVEAGLPYAPPLTKTLPDMVLSIEQAELVDTSVLDGWFTVYYTLVWGEAVAKRTLHVFVIDTLPPTLSLIIAKGTRVQFEAGLPVASLLHSLWNVVEYEDNYANFEQLYASRETDATEVVDTSVLGTYDVTVSVSDTKQNKAWMLVPVQVIDTTPPVIEAISLPAFVDNGALFQPSVNVSDFDPEPSVTTNISVVFMGSYTPFPACIVSASKDYGATHQFAHVPSRVSVDSRAPHGTIYSYIVIAVDASGSIAMLQHNITVRDTLPPTFTLHGSQAGFLEFGDDTSAVPLGVSAQDAHDGDLTAHMCIEVRRYNPVNQTVVGGGFNPFDVSIRTLAADQLELNSIRLNSPLDTLYDILYEVQDTAGHTASTTQKLLVRDSQAPRLSVVVEYETIVFGTRPPSVVVSAYDTHDGNVTAKVISNKDVTDINLWKAGTSSIVFSVSDSSRNVATNRVSLVVAAWVEPSAEHVVVLDMQETVGNLQDRLEAVFADIASQLSDQAYPFLLRLTNDNGDIVYIDDLATSLGGQSDGGASRRQRRSSEDKASASSNDKGYLELAARSSETFEWLSSSQLIDIISQVSSEGTVLDKTRASPATDRTVGSSNVVIGAAVGGGLAFIVFVVVSVLLIRRSGQYISPANSGAQPVMTVNPLFKPTDAGVSVPTGFGDAAGFGFTSELNEAEEPFYNDLDSVHPEYASLGASASVHRGVQQQQQPVYSALDHSAQPQHVMSTEQPEYASLDTSASSGRGEKERQSVYSALDHSAQQPLAATVQPEYASLSTRSPDRSQQSTYSHLQHLGGRAAPPALQAQYDVLSGGQRHSQGSQVYSALNHAVDAGVSRQVTESSTYSVVDPSGFEGDAKA